MFKTLPALAAIAVAGALLVPTLSQAAERDSVRVSYADLDLLSKIGQTRLERRIAFAAEMVCDTADTRDLAFGRAVKECRTGAVADAQPAFEAAVAAARNPSVTVLEAAALVVSAH
jgi:UrcA family protein